MSTTMLDDPATSESRASSRTVNPGADRSRARLLTGIVVIVAFAISTILQNVTLSRHRTLVANTGSEANISNLNSVSLALLLGGLRGPLVMMLWTSSETQKQDKDLEDFDSKIELIRLLQPEFDSVHIFQMWNKAYNVSVQMANKANKYATIIDALEYGYKINGQHSQDINIISQIGQLFFDKLGSSQEQQYYSDRVRRETFPDIRLTIPADKLGSLQTALEKAQVDPARYPTLLAQAQRGSLLIDKLSADVMWPMLEGPGSKYEAVSPQVFNENGRRVRLDPILDLNGRLTEAAAGPVGVNPDSLNSPVLAWLRQFEPFPYGVSPMAIGIAYYKRGQIIKEELHQKHLQLSDLVVDNRPAISAKNWAENEWGGASHWEMVALGKPIAPSANTSEERERNELPTAQVAPSTPVADVNAAKKAVSQYDLTVRIADVAMVEFVRHARNYPSAQAQFGNQREELDGMKAMCQADRNYLSAMLLPASAPERKSLLEAAAKQYRLCMLFYERVSLEHDMPDEKLLPSLPRGVSLEEFVEKLHQDALAKPQSLSQLDIAVKSLDDYLDAHRREDPHQSERQEHERYITRAYQRLFALQAEPK